MVLQAYSHKRMLLFLCLCACLPVCQAAPPKPSDAAVFIEHRPALDVYVKSFGGWAVGKTYLQVG